MEAKLKSISKTIPWYSVAKALVFGLAWLVFPYWLFLLVALGLYLIPFFRPFRYFLPFALILFFAFTLPSNIWAALLFGALFFLVVGIKDLVLVNRFLAYQTISVILTFLLFLNFFSQFEGPWGPGLLIWSVFIALCFALFLKNLVQFNLGEEGWNKKRKFLTFGLSGFLLWQWTMAMLFLPLNVFYATAIMFLAAVVLAEIIMDYSTNALTNRRLLTYFTILFVFISLVLAGNTWTV